MIVSYQEDLGHTALATAIKNSLTSRDIIKGRLADFHSDLQLVRSTRDRVLTKFGNDNMEYKDACKLYDQMKPMYGQMLRQLAAVEASIQASKEITRDHN
eukprot:8897808-Prorocentrum_lima.AAC.1